MLKILLVSLLGCFIAIAQANPDVKPLPAAKAFELSGHLDAKQQLVLHWKIAPGYYLYRDTVKVTPLADNQVKLGTAQLPTGLPRHDVLHGNFHAFENAVDLTLPLAAHQGRLAVKVNYQGCSTLGFCYTPMKKALIINLATVKPTQELLVDTATPIEYEPSLTDQHYVTQLLNERHYGLLIVSFLMLGLLLAFTPCVLPMVPILSSIIVGSGQQLNTKKTFLLSLSYVLGMAITYAAAGMTVALLGSNIQFYFEKPWVIASFAGLFVGLALSLFGWYEIRLPNQWQQRLVAHSSKQRGGNYVGVFVMGALSTLIVSPCVSAPLVGVLAYIGKSGDVILGAVALLALGLGMGVPLLLLGASAGKLLPKAGAWMDAIKTVFGLMLLAVAIWMLGRILPGPVALFLWAILVLISAQFIRRIQRSKRIWRHWHEGTGLILMGYALILLIGAVLGKSDPFYILATADDHSTPAFRIVKSEAELEQQLQLAKSEKRPVILDFYADWCVSCVIMDKNVFATSMVKSALEKFILLRADITQDNAFDQALLQRYHVVAPPTVVFFDEQSALLSDRTIVGEVDSQQFLKDLPQLEIK